MMSDRQYRFRIALILLAFIASLSPACGPDLPGPSTPYQAVIPDGDEDEEGEAETVDIEALTRRALKGLCHVTEKQSDYDCNEPAEHPCEHYYVDRKGNKVIVPSPSGCDEEPLNYIHYSYDENGNETAVRKSRTVIGEPFFSCSYKEYDDAGRVVESRYDLHCNGKWQTDCETFNHDDDGNEVSYFLDQDCDGLPDLCGFRDYNPNGKLRSYKVDVECNGSMDLCTTYVYTLHGEKLIEFEDENCDQLLDWDEDGYPYRRWCRYLIYDETGLSATYFKSEYCNGYKSSDCMTVSWDEQGNLVSYELDSDCNEYMPEKYKYTYDENGNVTVEWHNLDSFDYPKCVYYSYDENGNLTSRQYDLDCDGQPDNGCHGYTYNSAGEVVFDTSDHDCDGEIDSCSYETYNENGDTVFQMLDIGCDITPDSCRRYTYNEAGQEIRYEWDEDCDGIPDSSCTGNEYSERGLILLSYGDSDCDGSPDRECTYYTYECFD